MQIEQSFKKQTLMARQPILNAKLETVAYELLYRADSQSNEAVFDFSGSLATINVLLNSFTSIYQNNKLKRVPAFINFTEDLILKNTLPSLPSKQVVIEILEDVEVTDKLISCVKSMRKKGYTIALDDFLYDDKFIPLLKLAHIIKVDVLDMTPEQVTAQVTALKGYKVSLLAEKIETHEMFEHCKELGFKLFQGYFLAKPKIVEGRKIEPSQTKILKIVQALQNPNITASALEKLIVQDPAFTFKLLRIVNSSANKLVRNINSVLEAINILGIPEVKKWAVIIAMISNEDKPEELVRQLLIRGHMCEKVAIATGIDDSNGYMIAGMLSAAHALLDLDLEDLLSQVPLNQEIKTAISEGEGQMGAILRNTISFSQGNWKEVPDAPQDKVYGAAYRESLHWVSDTLNSVGE